MKKAALIARRLFRGEINSFPAVFDLWKLGKYYYVIDYGLGKFVVSRSKTELEAALDLQEATERVRNERGSLVKVEKIDNVRLINNKNPIWKAIKKDTTNRKMFSYPWHIM